MHRELMRSVDIETEHASLQSACMWLGKHAARHVAELRLDAPIPLEAGDELYVTNTAFLSSALAACTQLTSLDLHAGVRIDDWATTALPRLRDLRCCAPIEAGARLPASLTRLHVRQPLQKKNCAPWLHKVRLGAG